MKTEQLKVSGMTCGSCTSKVERALKAIAGVDDVDVSLSAGQATVTFDERQTSSGQLRAAVTNAGYSVDGAVAAVPGPKAKAGCCCS